MKIPLHLKPEDRSAAASAKRLQLWTAMMRENPKGFRQQSQKKRAPLNTMQMRLNWYLLEARYGT